MTTSVVTGNLLYELERLTLRLSEIVQRDFAPLEHQQLNWRPAPTQWSILECLLHLNYFAKHCHHSLEQHLKHRQHNTPSPYFSNSWLGNHYIQKYQLPPDNHLKKVWETPKEYAPSTTDKRSELDGQQILSDFEKQLQKLLKFVRDAHFLHLQRTKIPTFWWGLVRLSLGELLQILVYHNERHVVQAQRVLYHDHFPGNVSIDMLIAEL